MESIRILYGVHVVQRNVHVWFLLATGHLSEDQWFAMGAGLLETSHLCGNGRCITPFHAVVETNMVNHSRKTCKRVGVTPSSCPHWPFCRTYAFGTSGDAAAALLQRQGPAITKIPKRLYT